MIEGGSEAGLTEDLIVTIPSLSQASPSGVVYVSFTRAGGETDFAQASLQNTLRFISKEVDPSSGEPEEEGYDDTYQLEELELGVADYITPSWVNFGQEWDRLRTGSTATETFALTALGSLKGK